VLTKDCFVEAKRESGGAERLTGLEKADRRVWFEIVRSAPRSPVVRAVLNQTAALGLDRELDVPSRSTHP